MNTFKLIRFNLAFVELLIFIKTYQEEVELIQQ